MILIGFQLSKTVIVNVFFKIEWFYVVQMLQFEIDISFNDLENWEHGIFPTFAKTKFFTRDREFLITRINYYARENQIKF